MKIVKGPVGKEVSQSGTPTVSGVSIPYMGAYLVPMKKLRRELPPGSVLSPLVARAFLGRELRAVPGTKEVATFSFVDDLTLGARSRPKLEHAFDALRERLQGHPAGAVLLHVDPPTSVKHGRVRALGYILKPGRGYGDNFVHVHPGSQRFGRFHKKLYDAWKAAGQPSGFEELEAFILDRLRRWMPSQQAWTIVPVFSEHLALSCALAYVCEKEQGTGAMGPGLGPLFDSVDDILPFIQAKIPSPASPSNSGFMPKTSAELHAEKVACLLNWRCSYAAWNGDEYATR